MLSMKNNYSFQNLFPVKQIIYPTPPYMTIRRKGIEGFRLPVSSRKLMDMIKTFDPNDISYIDENHFTQRFENVTSIQDLSNKYFVIDRDNVWAKALGGNNSGQKVKFKIDFRNFKASTRPAITLQVQNQDLYLAYTPNKSRQLKVSSFGQGQSRSTNSDISDFLFYLVRVENRKYSFEPVNQPGCFISTSDDNSRVTVEPESDISHQRVFTFEPAFNISVGAGSKFMRPDPEEISRDDTTFYNYDDRIFQDRYKSILARKDYAMDVTSLALDRLYKWPQHDNHYQSNYMRRQYMYK